MAVKGIFHDKQQIEQSQYKYYVRTIAGKKFNKFKTKNSIDK